MLCKNYNLKPDELGKIPQRVYNELLDNVGAILGYENTGKIDEPKTKENKDKEHLEWMKEQGIFKSVKDG